MEVVPWAVTTCNLQPSANSVDGDDGGGGNHGGGSDKDPVALEVGA